ncbi:hypothetical protein [uncultured Corynebacterium sp.]|uniref:hypothetical protein n=1 Tax=uncultured Corynebacterium sp. TaxID=159447 RepID=UPI002889514A|nr:hypothetical protein [uncultured Corynebacterium sp.]
MSTANARCRANVAHEAVSVTLPVAVTLPYVQGRQILPRSTQFIRPIKVTIPSIQGTQISRNLTGYDPSDGVYFNEVTATYWDKNSGSISRDNLQEKFSDDAASRWTPYRREEPIHNIPEDWKIYCRIAHLDSTAVNRHLDANPIELQDLPMQSLTRTKRGGWIVTNPEPALDAAERIARTALRNVALIDGVLTDAVSEPVIVLRPACHSNDSIVRPWADIDWRDDVHPGETFFRLTNDIRQRCGNEYFDAMSVLDEASPAWTAPPVDQVLSGVKKQVQRCRNDLIAALEVQSPKDFDYFRTVNLFNKFSDKVMEQELLEGLAG